MTRMRSVSVALVTVVLLAWAAAPSVSAKSKMMANATVKSVSATSLTVTEGGKDMTFSVDSKTKVVGKGMGTKSEKKGGKIGIADLLKAGDLVTVTYDDAATPKASRVEMVKAK